MNEKDIQAEINRLNAEEYRLRAKLAVAKSPELKGAVETLEWIIGGIESIDKKLKEGDTKAAKKKRDSLNKKITAAKEKLTTLEEELKGISEAATIERLESERQNLVFDLKNAVLNNAAKFTAAQVDISQAIPGLERFEKDFQNLDGNII